MINWTVLQGVLFTGKSILNGLRVEVNLKKEAYFLWGSHRLVDTSTNLAFILSGWITEWRRCSNSPENEGTDNEDDNNDDDEAIKVKANLPKRLRLSPQP